MTVARDTVSMRAWFEEDDHAVHTWMMPARKAWIPRSRSFRMIGHHDESYEMHAEFDLY